MFQSLGIIQEHDDDPLLGRYFRVSTILFRPLSRSIIQAAHSIGARLFSCICACSGHGSDIAALAAGEVFSSLKAPIKQITGPHSPVPFAKELEGEFVPSPTKIRDAVTEVVNFK